MPVIYKVLYKYRKRFLELTTLIHLYLTATAMIFLSWVRSNLYDSPEILYILTVFNLRVIYTYVLQTKLKTCPYKILLLVWNDFVCTY